jgi:hypothetical protein
MKQLLSSTILLVLLISASVTTSAQKTQEEAIKKTLQQETSSYFHKNYDAWADTWVHDSADYIVRAGTSEQSELMGWNAISNEYKQSIKNLSVMDDATIAPFLNKKDFHFYINGNVATVTFNEGQGDKSPNFETRTLVKQNGAWKILNFTLIDKSSYALQNIMNNMKVFMGKWELDGKATMEPSNGVELKSLKVELKQTPNGLEQHSDLTIISKNQWHTVPTEYEYFIPDYNTNTITYMDISKNAAGQTYTQTGTVTSEQPNSFTVKIMDPNKPTIKQTEYTVTMQDGKWHQVVKGFGRDGKVTFTATIDLHRM